MIARSTSCWIRVGVVEFEGNSFYEVAEIIGAADLVRIRRRGGTTNSNSPFVGVLRGDRLLFFGGQHLRSVSIYYWPKDADALRGACVRATSLKTRFGDDALTLTRTRSPLAMMMMTPKCGKVS